jgi:hypothetical protein
MWIDKSYWGVQGWEVSTTTGASYAPCFYLTPNYSTPVQIHHLILANNVANGCQGSGINVANQSTTASIDYVSLVGNIVYNAAQSSSGCQSGITVYQPIQSDSLPGTHIYVAGNFSYGNLEPSTCGGHAPTDGEGIIFDTFDGSQGGLPSPYSAQAVADNNILVANGAKGLEVYNNTTGAAHAAIYLRNNTTWGNLTDPNQPSWTDCGELDINAASKVEAFGNIFVTNSATGCGANSIYAMSGISSDGTNHVYNNFAAGMSGHNTIITNSGTFAFGPNNTLGTSPSFANPVPPGAPRCGSASSVPNCMATVIANFTATNAAAIGYGYQTPSSVQTYDPLFPLWLCNVNLPAGLVTMGCLTGP